MSIKKFYLTTHYFKSFTNRSMRLVNSIKLFYIVNASKLISKIKYIVSYTDI